MNIYKLTLPILHKISLEIMSFICYIGINIVAMGGINYG